ncbi:hypothetical protein GCM10010415_37830 [Streptomyces atrovirens]
MTKHTSSPASGPAPQWQTARRPDGQTVEAGAGALEEDGVTEPLRLCGRDLALQAQALVPAPVSARPRLSAPGRSAAVSSLYSTRPGTAALTVTCFLMTAVRKRGQKPYWR